jgi:para-nitrobenzyl esterase
MRLIPLAAVLALTLGSPAAFAQAPQAAPAAGAEHYSTSATPIGTLLDDPAAKAVLTKYIPDTVNNPQIDMARSMTLKDTQQYAPDSMTDAVLAKIDAELALLPAKK